MGATITNHDVARMTAYKRAEVRLELAQMHDRLPSEGLSFVISQQVLETALHATDAVTRVAELADALAPLDDESPLGEIGFIIAEQIRKALKG